VGSNPAISTLIFTNILKRPLVNNQIRAPQVRVIDESGKQLGVVDLQTAYQMAQERNLDLVQVTEKVDPPVCKLTDYGKYVYWEEKKEKKQKGGGEIKGIRLSFAISQHDLETRAQQAEKFLKKGDILRVEMVLRGREKALQYFAKEKIRKFLDILNARTPIKVERDLKKEARGFTMIISKG
jgi:translation initiation factor IF-3